MGELIFNTVNGAASKNPFNLEKKLLAMIIAKEALEESGIKITYRELQKINASNIDPVLAEYFSAFGARAVEVITRSVERNGGNADAVMADAKILADNIVKAF